MHEVAPELARVDKHSLSDPEIKNALPLLRTQLRVICEHDHYIGRPAVLTLSPRRGLAAVWRSVKLETPVAFPSLRRR